MPAGEGRAGIADLAVDAENLVEIEDRVGEHCGAVSLDQFLRLTLFGLIFAVERI